MLGNTSWTIDPGGVVAFAAFVLVVVYALKQFKKKSTPFDKIQKETPRICPNCGAEYNYDFVPGYSPLERCCHGIPDSEQKALWKHRINKNVPLNEEREILDTNHSLLKACTHCYSQVPLNAKVCPNCGDSTEPLQNGAMPNITQRSNNDDKVSNACPNCGAVYNDEWVREYKALERCCQDLPSHEQQVLWNNRINKYIPLKVNP